MLPSGAERYDPHFVDAGAASCLRETHEERCGDIHGPKPYKFIGFGDIYGPKPYKFIGFGDIHGPKPNWFPTSRKPFRSPKSTNFGLCSSASLRVPDPRASWAAARPPPGLLKRALQKIYALDLFDPGPGDPQGVSQGPRWAFRAFPGLRGPPGGLRDPPQTKGKT